MVLDYCMGMKFMIIVLIEWTTAAKSSKSYQTISSPLNCLFGDYWRRGLHSIWWKVFNWNAALVWGWINHSCLQWSIVVMVTMSATLPLPCCLCLRAAAACNFIIQTDGVSRKIPRQPLLLLEVGFDLLPKCKKTFQVCMNSVCGLCARSDGDGILHK